MASRFAQFFCQHNFKKLRDESFRCNLCEKTKPKSVANVRDTNSYNSNMKIIEHQIQIEKEKKKK
jgi:hypothetical protein